MTSVTDINDASGEIGSLADSPLQAGSLDDFRSHEAKQPGDAGYGDDADERAIARISKSLGQAKAGRGKSSDELTEQAESLYALCCSQVQAGATGAQLERIADLVGERPDELAQRLNA